MSPVAKALAGAELRPMPTAIHPMLATAVAKAFDNPDWLFEIKWDGYRAIAFIEAAKTTSPHNFPNSAPCPNS